MLRRSVIIGITVLILLSAVVTGAALVRKQPAAQSASASIHEAGHVLAVTQLTRVLNKDGTSKTLPCQLGVSLDSPEDVVVWSDTPIIIPGGNGYFYQVAFPDPCQAEYDFSSTSQLQDGTGAIGYVLASNLVETNAVQIDPHAISRDGALWRDCWGPTKGCPDRHTPEEQLHMPSADRYVLYAWWDGNYWQPRWWHVVDAQGNSAAVYGRDWQAITTNIPPPVPPTPTPTPDPVQVHYVEATKAITVPEGARGNVTIALTVKNIGSVSWSSDAGFSLAGFYCNGEGCPAAVGLGVMDFQQPFGNVVVPPGAIYQFFLSTPLDTTSIFGQSYAVLWKLFQHGALVPDDNALSSSNFCQFCTTIEVGAPLSTTTPPQLMDNSLWIANSPTQAVQPGQQFSITFTYKNNGTTIWSDSRGYALECDTHYHSNNNNCMGGQSIGLGGQTVPPGQQFTFTFNLMAPSSPGTYQTWWDMTHNGNIFGNNNSYVTVTVQSSNSITPTPTSPPNDDAKFLGQSTWPTVQTGQQYTIYFVLQNIGNTSWSDAGGYDLACTSLCLGAPKTIGFSGQSVGPTQQYQFNINQVAPSTPGTYRTDWVLEHNGQPFGLGLYSYVTVPVLQQQAPVCNNSGGTNWSSPSPTAVSYSCPGNGLLMQQVSSTKYAEFDLTQATGGSYNQTNFQVQVQVTFQNAGDCNTWAAIIFQTPVSSPGGYIFGITSCGQWRLQQVISGTEIPVVAKGNIAINASQPVAIVLGVQNGTLNASFNSQQALSYSVGSPSGTAEVGLMVERDNAAPSSQVLYSNFELDA